jgi:L-rhamnose mutarotase
MNGTNYRKYALSCADCIHELVELLDEDDIKEFAIYLKEISSEKYLIWVRGNAPLIEHFLLATPSQRKQKKYQKFQNMTRVALILACIQRAHAAHSYLKSILHFGIDFPTSYREKLLSASQACVQVYTEIPNIFYYWPFEDVCKSPFAS